MILTILVFLNMVARGLATDPGTKESTYGGTFNFGKAVSHCIKLQEDNYEHWFTGLMNVLLGISGVAYITQLLQVIVEELQTPVFVDNSGAVSLAKNFNSCKRAKHINRRVHFLNDYTESGKIVVHHIPTKDNTADIFTKPLPKVLFLKHRSTILV